jgi:hypothetical protein
MLSLRTIFRLMLCVWFLGFILIALMLTQRMGIESSGALVARLFAEPPTSRTLPMKSPPKPPEKTKPPEPVKLPEPAKPPAPWQILPDTKTAGEGSIGKPVFTSLADGGLEMLLPYKGTLGGATRFFPRDVGIETRRDAVLVDLHGQWRFNHPTNVPIHQSDICRVQAYPHPGYVRVSAISCLQEADPPTLTVEAFYSARQIRIVFGKKKG